MAPDLNNKRKYERIYFSLVEDVTGIFVFPDLSQGSFSASILNLSLGGLQFSLKRDELNGLTEGSSLTLTQLKGVDGLLCDGAIPITIRWVLDHPEVSNISLGCQFEEMSEGSLEKLGLLIDKKQLAEHVG
jgi:hypothetical protein